MGAPQPVVKIVRYGVLAYLSASVIFTMYSFLNYSQDSDYYPIRSSQSSSLVETGQAIFDVNSTVYSKQIMTWKTSHGKHKHSIHEDAVIHKVFSSTIQPSKVLPYYFKANQEFDPEAVTITTLITFDRYPVFSKLVTNYQGPISVSIHINDDEARDENLSKLHEMYSSNPYMKQFVDVHVVVDKFNRQFNMWRNVARFFARTNYFMMLDVDFHICTNLKQHLALDPEARQLMRQGSAVLLPAFEYVDQEDGIDSTTFPKDKESLIQLIQSKKLTTFHDFFPKGHNATDYERWYQTDSVYKVTSYQHSYEPYVILKREGTPWCDERFVGYGANKAACLFEIYISGIDYYVLPNDFLIHQSHPYKEETRKQERKYNRKLYQNFQEETCFRYSRNFLASNEWDTPRSANLREQCNRIKGFTKAMHLNMQEQHTLAEEEENKKSIIESAPGNEDQDITSQEILANVNTTINAKTMEMELKSTLREIHTLVGTRVDTQNIDQVLQQRLEALAALRSEDIEKQTHQEEQGQQEDNNQEPGAKSGFAVDDNKPNVDSEDVRTQFVIESVRLLVNLEEILLRLIRDRDTNDPTNDKELLGLMDQRMIHTMLEIIVCWGIYPWLLPGVGMPLNRRVRSNIVQKELFTAGPGAGTNASSSTGIIDKPVDRIKSTNLLWSIIEPLARITVAYSPKVTRFTTLGSILASRHVPDLYAALLQLAYRPLPKPKDVSQSESNNVVVPEQEATTPKPKKLTPGSLISKSVKQELKPTQQPAAPTDEDGPERAHQLQIKEESAKLFHDLFWNTEAARSLESLTTLLSSSSPMHPTPVWLKSVSGRFLSQILLRPGGVRVVLEYMQGGTETVKLDQLEKVARLVTSVPDQMSSVQEYYCTICPELLEILEMDLHLLNPKKSKTSAIQQIRIAPPSPQLVQTTTFVVSKLLTKNPAICQVEIVAKEVEPLWKWGTRANRKEPVAADTVPREIDNEKSRLTTVEDAGDDSDEEMGLDQTVASEYEITKAVLFLHSFLVGNEPSPSLFQAFLSQAAQGLYQLYEYLTQVRSVLRDKVKEILVVYFRILDPNDTVEVLKTIVMRRRLPVPKSKPWQDIVSHDGTRIGKLVEMGSVGESYFAPGPTGGAVLRRRSDLETSGHEGEILGDLYMYLLDEYQAGKSRGANAISPRRMLTMLQLILNMTQKLGPSIMSKVTQIIGLANNILEHHFSSDVVEPVEVEEELEEEADLDILSLVLTLLSAILTENEHLSQQDRHLLSLTLVHIKKLSDHPLIEIRRVAHDLQTLIPTRLNSTGSGEGEDAPRKTEMEIEMEKYASALAALQDSLLPVRAHGLHILRDMILAKSIVLTQQQSGVSQDAERELDHALDIFVQHVQEPDSFIYLNAVKGLAALTDAHGPEILRKLMRIYANEDGKQKLDTRLRIGEALVQTVQRCGEALGGYLDALLPGLYKVMNTAVDKKVLEARDEERRKHIEKANANKASEALLTAEEKQRKWKLEREKKKESQGVDGNNEDEDEDAIVDEVSLLRSSALTILATAAENCPTALLPEMRYLVDWVLSILDLDRQIEVRRAATLVIVLLFRALGSNSLYSIEGDQLKRAYRTLRYVEEVDEDALCRAQARTGIADLDSIVRAEMGSGGSRNGGGNVKGSVNDGILRGVGTTQIRYK
ncbi:hypothetical protein BGZ49_010174 [Haplosporangium sp. Z 27]|nr:hypothetical protein BGZ49_010174 [Haplosporangium sp. Z 27]